jgi:Xaa-Pro aminopeptidase
VPHDLHDDLEASGFGIHWREKEPPIMTAATSMFPAQTYVQRRSQLQSHFEDGLLLFLGNDDSPKNYADNTYDYRQDSTFLYYMGVDHAGWAALIDIDAGVTTAYADDLDIDAIV